MRLEAMLVRSRGQIFFYRSNNLKVLAETDEDWAIKNDIKINVLGTTEKKHKAKSTISFNNFKGYIKVIAIKDLILYSYLPFKFPRYFELLGL